MSLVRFEEWATVDDNASLCNSIALVTYWGLKELHDACTCRMAVCAWHFLLGMSTTIATSSLALTPAP